MFAIKHMNERGDFFMQTEGVNFHPNGEPKPIGDSGYPSHGEIWIDDQKFVKDGAPRIINNGTVYIMNELGKTVSKYHLSSYGLLQIAAPETASEDIAA